MKIIITKLIAISTLIFLASSCQKETSQPEANEILQLQTKQVIVNQPIEKQRAYIQENLKIIISEMGPLLKETNFRNLIKTEISKKFDGGYDVLIKTLLSNSVYGQRLNTEKMKKAVNAFMNIGGENLYPQIYIPFFDKHQAKRDNILARTTTGEGGGPEVVIYDGDEGNTSVPSYTYNEEGSIIPTGTIVNEEYALNNEIYIISINESVNGDGEIQPIVNSPAQTQSIVNFRIKDLTIKDGKESWLGGASEIHIKSNGTTWSHILAGNTSGPFVSIPNAHYTGQTELQGHEIRTIPRGEIGYPILNLNYSLNTNWTVDNYFVDPIVYTYVIFEYDKWPAGLKVLTSTIPSAPNPNYGYDVMNFRSSNTPYGGIPSNTNINYAIYGNVSGLTSAFQYLYYDGHHINTENIEFNTVGY